MAVPGEQVILVDSAGNRIDLDELVEHLRRQPERVLADDEIGFVAYVVGLDLYSLTPTDSGEFLAAPVTQLSRPRFSKEVLRKQIGATVMSVTADAIFVIKDGETLRKVRAEKLEPGAILASGEKVYR